MDGARSGEGGPVHVMEKRFFEFLTHDERVDCLALGTIGKQPGGAKLLQAGDRPHALFVLLAGAAEVRRGDGVVLARLVSGDIFGEMSFIQGVRASADVVATTDVTVLTLADAVINELFKERPGLAAGLYRSLAVELAQRLRATSAAKFP
jgi:CRP/FNR family transcriptional regulator, cyclic AMP receptor protein